MGIEPKGNEKHLPMWNIKIEIYASNFCSSFLSFIWFSLKSGIRWPSSWFRVHSIALAKIHWNFVFWYWTIHPKYVSRQNENFSIENIRKKSNANDNGYIWNFHVRIRDIFWAKLRCCQNVRCTTFYFIKLSLVPSLISRLANGEALAWACQCGAVNLNLSHSIFNFAFVCPLAHSNMVRNDGVQRYENWSSCFGALS